MEVGGPAYVSGYNGDAISLDGVNDVVQLPGNLMPSNFSVAFWVRTSATAPSGTYWWQGLGMVDGEECGAPAGGDTGIALIDGGHVIMRQTKTTATINDGTFHAVAVTRAGTDIKIFIDGVADASGLLGSANPLTGMSWIGVGNNPCDSSFNRLWFPGQIDELRFYNRVLTQPEIELLAGMGNTPAISPAGLIVFAILLVGARMAMLRGRRRALSSSKIPSAQF